MEEIREAALAYYDNGSEELKQLARDFFHCLDEDRDGTVDLREFINIFGEGSNRLMNSRNFFQALDHDGNGYLDFFEVLSLYYIFKSGRTVCDGCRSFLKGLFFTCLDCHESSDITFDLCSACYRSKKFNHQHATFLDNYALLTYKRRAMLAYQTKRAMGQPSTTQVIYIIIIIIIIPFHPLTHPLFPLLLVELFSGFWIHLFNKKVD